MSGGMEGPGTHCPGRVSPYKHPFTQNIKGKITKNFNIWISTKKDWLKSKVPESQNVVFWYTDGSGHFEAEFGGLNMKHRESISMDGLAIPYASYDFSS